MISPRGKRFALALALVAAGTGCAEKKLLLEYRFPPGYEGHYRWSVQAVRSIQSPTEQTTSRLDAVLDMKERIRREPGGRTILAVRLEPLSVKENGEAAAIPPPSSAEYEIDNHGRIRRLVKAGLSSGTISSLELDALAYQIRPPLSGRPVGLGETWDAPLKVRGQRTSIDFRGAGRLVGFDLKDRRRLSRIETHREGNITSNEVLNDAPVLLRGRSRSDAVSSLDLDRGVLFSSHDKSTSHFDVLLSNRPAAKLDVTLTSRLQLQARNGQPGARG